MRLSEHLKNANVPSIGFGGGLGRVLGGGLGEGFGAGVGQINRTIVVHS